MLTELRCIEDAVAALLRADFQGLLADPCRQRQSRAQANKAGSSGESRLCLQSCPLARYFGVPITAFFPEASPKSRTTGLLSATTGLDDADLDEVRLYALFRKSRRRVKRTK